VGAGNRELLLREQERVIQDDYDAMRDHHGPMGDVFTYGFSTMADNPMPGGEAYRDYDPIVLGGKWDTPEVPIGPLGPFGPHWDWDPPDVGAHVTLPLPAATCRISTTAGAGSRTTCCRTIRRCCGTPTPPVR
jgi:hypothetical protein